MKKNILLLLAIAGLVACGSKEKQTQSTPAPAPEVPVAVVDSTPWLEYQALLDSTITLLEGASDRDLIIEEYIEKSYDLLMANIDNVVTDSIILDLFHNLAPEQKAQVYEKVVPERWQNGEGMQTLHSKYQAELLTAPGQPYIDVQALDEEGNVVRLSELVGQADYLLVDFWASWCRPCRQLIPEVKNWYAKYQPTGQLEVVGISIDSNESDWREALDEEDMAWLQLHDTNEAPNNPRVAYGISGIPTTLLIDRDGMIVLRNPSEEEIVEIMNN